MTELVINSSVVIFAVLDRDQDKDIVRLRPVL